jgi:hypothetical protein
MEGMLLLCVGKEIGWCIAWFSSESRAAILAFCPELRKRGMLVLIDKKPVHAKNERTLVLPEPLL